MYGSARLIKPVKLRKGVRGGEGRTFVYDTFESCKPILELAITPRILGPARQKLLKVTRCSLQGQTHVLMTLNKRLDTAAAAMVQRMINRSSPRVLRAASPFNKGSIELEAMSEELER